MLFEIHPLVHIFLVPSFVLSITIASFMIWRGPEDIDRMVALEWMGGVSIALAAYYALIYGDMNIIDIALAIALLGYLSTAFLSLWLEKEKLR